MAAREDDSVAQTYRAEMQALLRRLVPVGVTLFLLFAAASGAVEWFYFPERRGPLIWLHVAYTLTCVGHLALVRYPAFTVVSGVVGLNVLSLAVATYFAAVRGSAELCALILAVILASLAVLYPWGLRGQALGSIGALVGYPVALGTGLTTALPPVYGVYGLVAAAMLAVAGAALIDRHRFAAYRDARALTESNAVSSALAQVGHELISSLDRPVLLDRLCGVTIATLDCDATYTLLWEAKGEAFVPVSGRGAAPEEWEAARLLRLPRAALAPLLAQLAHEDVITVSGATVAAAEPVAALFERFGMTHALCIALRLQDEIIGIHAATYRESGRGVGPRQFGIARGIAQLASLALENARLVEELDRAKTIEDHFVATLSHELKNPIGAFIGYAEMLLSGAFGELTGEQTDTVARMQARAQESLDVITATLDLSRFQAQRIPLDVQEIRIAAFVEDLRREVRLPADKTALQLRWYVAADLPALHSDPVKLRMVLKNLLGNAVKFTEQGSVTLEAVRDGDGIEFRVADTGVGIPAGAQATLFDPFTQAHGAASRRKGGAGLGLYIVRRLVEVLDGRIGVASEVGRGSTFTVWLPRAHLRSRPSSGAA